MYFNHAFRKSFLPATPGNTLSLTNATPQALTAGQIGIYSASWSILSTATESITPFYIVMGSYFNSDKISPALGGYKESVKSKLVNPKYISRVIRINANAPRQMVIQVPVTCGLACDTTYRLRVDVKCTELWMLTQDAATQLILHCKKTLFQVCYSGLMKLIKALFLTLWFKLECIR
jgi:hypothetical protein